ncbi:hypothetical protein [Zestomonas thermotolerans]|uniref:hypothetical protein n=1 Tax=Zestomonas thermotolerans TaxID=157784 RepID=UPI00035F1DDB|nr:hypothetical protein [Pseudomonas thermotolerans]
MQRSLIAGVHSMSSVKAWRRAALVAYIAAGVGLTGGGFATVKANESAQVAALRAYIWRAGRMQQDQAELATAVTAASDDLVLWSWCRSCPVR